MSANASSTFRKYRQLAKKTAREHAEEDASLAQGIEPPNTAARKALINPVIGLRARTALITGLTTLLPVGAGPLEPVSEEEDGEVVPLNGGRAWSAMSMYTEGVANIQSCTRNGMT